MVDIRKSLIAAGVKNLREYGYPDCTESNILTDRIYSAFFKSMLGDNLGFRKDVDAEIEKLIAECSAVRDE